MNQLEWYYSQTINYTKGTANDKVTVLTNLDKTQRNIGLLCAVLKVVSCSL